MRQTDGPTVDLPWLALAWVGNAAQGLQPWFRFQTHGVRLVRVSCPKLVKFLASLLG